MCRSKIVHDAFEFFFVVVLKYKFSMVQKQIFILHFVSSLFLAQRLEIAILTFLLDFGL